jgi:hypothetical protein
VPRATRLSQSIDICAPSWPAPCLRCLSLSLAKGTTRRSEGVRPSLEAASAHRLANERAVWAMRRRTGGGGRAFGRGRSLAGRPGPGL